MYYIIKNNFKDPGVPPILNAVLAEDFNIKNPMPPMAGYSWTKKKSRIYPEKLFLVSKDKLYKFDYIRYWDGYIISKEFKEVFDNHFSKKYKSVKLNVIGWKNKIITDKEYFFIDISLPERTEYIDYDKSKFSLDNEMITLRGLKVEKVQKSKDFYGNIKNYDSLVLDESNLKENVFQLKDTVVHDLLCSNNFKDELIRNNISGINYLETDNMNLYHNYFRE